MRRFQTLRALVVAMLVLPGLVIAAPIAGPCGYCDEGVACPMMAEEKTVQEEDSCCGEPAQSEPVAPSDHLSKCDCGQEVPPAVTVDPAPTSDPTSYALLLTNVTVGKFIVTSVSVGFAHPGAPPPSPSIFLLNCVFLT